jgi:hypothetical protein
MSGLIANSEAFAEAAERAMGWSHNGISLNADGASSGFDLLEPFDGVTWAFWARSSRARTGPRSCRPWTRPALISRTVVHAPRSLGATWRLPIVSQSSGQPQ